MDSLTCPTDPVCIYIELSSGTLCCIYIYFRFYSSRFYVNLDPNSLCMKFPITSEAMICKQTWAHCHIATTLGTPILCFFCPLSLKILALYRFHSASVHSQSLKCKYFVQIQRRRMRWACSSWQFCLLSCHVQVLTFFHIFSNLVHIYVSLIFFASESKLGS